MKRAALLIGVNKTGDLPVLGDAANGARRMAKWAGEQGFDKDDRKDEKSIVILTDDNDGRVEVQDVFDAIERFVNKTTIEQLIVYFAGHAVNNGYGERWLLSRAPRDPNAAVNLNGTAEVAHHCGIPHVVFISDACRTAAEGISAQAVSGSIVFPNPSGGAMRPEGAVDRFWACLVGDPAAEILDPETSAREYSALYTGILLGPLSGKIPALLQANGAGVVVRPRPLKAYLPAAMAQELSRLKLTTRLIQVPDARITSEEDAWVAYIDASKVPAAPRPPAPAPGGGVSKAFINTGATEPEHLESASVTLLRSAMSGIQGNLGKDLDGIRLNGAPAAQVLAGSVARTIQTFAPQHFETECGFTLRGARLVEAFAARGRANVIKPDLVRLDAPAMPGTAVLLVFDGGNGTVLPAIPGFIGVLTFEGRSLVDVSYEPSYNTARWHEFDRRATEVRTLRAIAASATRSGVFRLEGQDALGVARKMQYAKGIDPSLAVYAAYGYLDLRRSDLIRSMSNYMQDDLGMRFFDIAMLARELDDKAIKRELNVLPYMPLLSQGWALVDAHRIKLPSTLTQLQVSRLSSVWTLFNPEGVKRLRDVIHSSEVL